MWNASYRFYELHSCGINSGLYRKLKSTMEIQVIIQVLARNTSFEGMRTNSTARVSSIRHGSSVPYAIYLGALQAPIATGQRRDDPLAPRASADCPVAAPNCPQPLRTLASFNTLHQRVPTITVASVC